jgi:predicted transcriptional regulator
MANKIDTAISAIQTKLAELVTAGTVKAVAQEMHDPISEQRFPVIGLLFMGASRAGGTAAPLWRADVVLRIVQRTKAGASSSTITDLIKAVQEKLDAVSNAGTFAGAIELGNWQAWYHFGVANVPVGASCAMRIQFEGSL